MAAAVNVRHFFSHEGGAGNIERSDYPSDVVWGVLHQCKNAHLALLDAAEAYGHGYNRTEVTVQTDRGEQRAIVYVGNSSFLDESCLPTRRYLNICGVQQLPASSPYVDSLHKHAVYEPTSVPAFVPPAGEYRTFSAATLSQQPFFTALSGAVFDMSCARWQHTYLRGLFGGRDMTSSRLMMAADILET